MKGELLQFSLQALLFFSHTWRRCTERPQHWVYGSYKIPQNEHGYRSFNAQTFMFQDFYKKHVDFTYSGSCSPFQFKERTVVSTLDRMKQSLKSPVFPARIELPVLPNIDFTMLEFRRVFIYLIFLLFIYNLDNVFLRFPFLQIKAENIP